MVIASYDLLSPVQRFAYRASLLCSVPAFVGLGIFFKFSTRDGLIAGAVWLTWFTYYNLTRILRTVELTADELRGKSLLVRSGAHPVSQVTEIRVTGKSGNRYWKPRTAAIHFSDRKPLTFEAPRPGLQEFLASLQEVAPEVSILTPVR
jgi:hypothetical protein